MTTPNDTLREVLISSIGDLNDRISEIALKLEFYIEELKGSDLDIEKRLTILENEGIDP